MVLLIHKKLIDSLINKECLVHIDMRIWKLPPCLILYHKLLQQFSGFLVFSYTYVVLFVFATHCVFKIYLLSLRVQLIYLHALQPTGKYPTKRLLCDATPSTHSVIRIMSIPTMSTRSIRKMCSMCMSTACWISCVRSGFVVLKDVPKNLSCRTDRMTHI